MTSSRPRRGNALVKLAAAAATILVSVGVFAAPASAADLSATVSDPTLTQSDGTPFPDPAPINVGTWVRFGATWSITGAIADGDTFTVELPAGFEPVTAADFPLLGAGNTTLANCSYTPGASPGEIVCTFNGGPYDGATGDIWFVAAATEEMTNETLTWTLGGTPVVIANVTVGPHSDEAVPVNVKTGGVRIEGNAAMGHWDIRMIPTAGTTSFTITDVLDSTAPNRPHEFVPGSETLYRFPLINGNEYNPNNGEVVYSEGTVPGVVYSGTPLSTMTLTLNNLEPGYYYRYSYVSTSIGATAIVGDTFKNNAIVNGEQGSVIGVAAAFGGGGGNPNFYVSFSVTKDLHDTTGLVTVKTFSLTASTDAQSNAMNIPADGTTVLSPYFQAGSPITLCEEVPVISGVLWKSPVISGEGVTGPDSEGCYSINPQGGSLVELTLTNTAVPTPTTVPATLAQTGSANQDAWGALAVALLLVATGGALWRRSRKSHLPL